MFEFVLAAVAVSSACIFLACGRRLPDL